MGEHAASESMGESQARTRTADEVPDAVRKAVGAEHIIAVLRAENVEAWHRRAGHVLLGVVALVGIGLVALLVSRARADLISWPDAFLLAAILGVGLMVYKGLTMRTHAIGPWVALTPVRLVAMTPEGAMSWSVAELRDARAIGDTTRRVALGPEGARDVSRGMFRVRLADGSYLVATTSLHEAEAFAAAFPLTARA